MNKIIVATATLFTLHGTVAWAVDKNWVGAVGVEASWLDGDNWNPTGAPGSGSSDTVYINNGGISYIGSGENISSVIQLFIARTTSGNVGLSGGVTVDSGNLTVYTTQMGNTGALKVLNGGSFSSSSFFAGYNAATNNITVESGGIMTVGTGTLRLGTDSGVDMKISGPGSFFTYQGSNFQSYDEGEEASFRSLTVADGGTFRANNADVNLSGWVINFGSGSAVGSIQAKSIMVNDTTVINFNSADDYAFGTVMTDSYIEGGISTASLNQIGTGTTTLAMMHNGAVSVNNGKLVLDSASLGETDVLLTGTNAVNIGGAATVGILELTGAAENSLINDSAVVSFLGNGVLSVANRVTETLGSVNVSGGGNGIDFSGDNNLLTINTLTLNAGYILSITGWDGEYSLDGATLLAGSGIDVINVSSIVGDLDGISWDFIVDGYEFKETALIDGHLVPVFSQIPEPSAYAMIIGLVGLSAVVCRRRRK